MRRATALLLLLATACTGAPAPPPAAPAAWTVELSTAPTLLALDGDDVWAASYGNGVGGSQVYRVDRETGRRAAQRTLAGQPHGLAVAPDGALWLSTVRLPDQPGGTGLQVLDPETLQTRREVGVPGVPLGLAFVDGALWVGSDDGVRRLGAAGAGPLVATAEAALRLLAAGPGRLLVAGRSTLTLVDAAAPTGAGAVLATRRVASSGSLVPAAGAAGTWVVAPDAEDRAQLIRVDPVTLAPAARAPSPGRAGAIAAVQGDRLWVSDPGGGRLLCADAASGEVRAARGAPVSGPLVADDRAVVVATASGLRSLPADC